MSVREIESAIKHLSPGELSRFEQWFDEFVAQQWDKQFAADVKAGRLDRLGKQADAEFEAGRCKKL